jgi:hypothetical protein
MKHTLIITVQTYDILLTKPPTHYSYEHFAFDTKRTARSAIEIRISKDANSTVAAQR